MVALEIRQLCYLQQKECAERGHSEFVWARRIASNGSVFIRKACPDCGKTTSLSWKSKDHPHRASYPEVIIHSGACFCLLCDQQRADVQAFRDHLNSQRAVIRETAGGRSDHISNDDWAAYLESEAWKVKRSQCHERYGYRCAICNRAEELQAHHRTYVRVTREAPTDLISLCRGCHELFHFGRRP